MAKRRVKKSFKVFVVGLLFFLTGLFLIGLDVFYTHDITEIKIAKAHYNNQVFKIKLSDSFKGLKCAVTKDNANKATIKWKSVHGHTCKYNANGTGKYSVYIKDSSNIKKLGNFSKTFYSSLYNKKDIYYMAVGSKEKIKIDYVSIDSDVSLKSDNNNIVEVNGNTITAKSKGKAKISLGDESFSVVVTNLIDKMPKKYNYNRNYLPCNAFSEKEAKLLDKILASRINDAGYKTRAGVVAAARFLTLEFPYRIAYFSENGRMGPPYNRITDGEGRYYHKGLYLSSDKFKDIKTSVKGPATWGCKMYSKPSKGYRSNGLDCSGFTTWVVLNGGFDIGDLPAYSGDHSAENLNNYGKELLLTYDVAMSGKIKAGDLLGEVTVSEGHSAIVIGVDKNYYYVAESLWHSPLGVNVNKYQKTEFHKYFETVNLMDSYYKKDGNYTAMWY